MNVWVLVSALTSYSPSVLALNDMLRQQLQLTNQFLQNHRRMHHAYVGSMNPEFTYTTLQDTKQVNNTASYFSNKYTVQWNSSIRATPFAEILWPLLRGGHSWGV